MQPLYRGTSVALAVALLSGCAMRQSRTPQPSPAPAKAPAGATAPAESLSDYMQKIRHLSASVRPVSKNEAVETLEARDPQLAAELLSVAAQPSAAAYCGLAEHYRQRGVLDAAYRNFNRALALNPREALAYEGLARVWRDWGQPALAVADAHRATYYAPQSAAVRNTYGTVMQALGRYKDARAAYELASSLDPQAAYAVNNLCYLAFLGGRIDDAIATCNRALQLDPSLTTARNNLALAFAAAGHADLARAQFVEAIDTASGFYNMGIVYLAAGDHASALQSFDEASKARPTFHQARERARHIRAQMFLTSRQARIGAADVTWRPNGAAGH